MRAPQLTSLCVVDAATGRVIAATPDVRDVGVATGESRHRAQQKAPFAAVIEANSADYYALHDAAFSALGDFADRMETVGLGEFLLEWTSTITRDFSSSGYDFQVEVLARAMCDATGLRVRIGVANHRFTAQQAARAVSDDGIVVIDPGKDARSLAHLPISVLPTVTHDMLGRLRDFGIYTLGQLAKLSDASFARQFGGKHRWLRDLARGRDPRPLHPDAPPLRLLREHRFRSPTPRLTDVIHVAQALAQTVSRQLDTGGYRAEALRLSLTFAHGQPYEIARALKPPTADTGRITWSVAELVKSLKLRSPISSVVLVAYPIRPWHVGSTRQLSLFDAEEEAERSRFEARQQQVEMSIAPVQRRYGEQCVCRASELPPPKPAPAQVKARADGKPLKLSKYGEWLDIVSIEELWCHEWGWWDEAERHDYYRVLLTDGTLHNLFRDISGRWYVDKAWLVL